MATISMNFLDAINTVRCLKDLTKDFSQQLTEYIKTMPLPNDVTDVQRLTLQIWVDHYTKGECSLESLQNISESIGCGGLFTLPPYQLEVSKDGKLTVYNKE